MAEDAPFHIPGLNELPTTPFASGHLNEEALPWVEQGMGVEMKILHVSDTYGTWVVLQRMQPGTMLPTHRHSGRVFGYTLAGRWHYLEHDFIATAGSFIHEPANGAHTLHVFEDAAEPAVIFFAIEGALVNYGPNGEMWGVSDAQTQLAEYLRLAKEQGHSLDPKLIIR